MKRMHFLIVGFISCLILIPSIALSQTPTGQMYYNAVANQQKTNTLMPAPATRGVSRLDAADYKAVIAPNSSTVLPVYLSGAALVSVEGDCAHVREAGGPRIDVHHLVWASQYGLDLVNESRTQTCILSFQRLVAK